ncbi:MAG: phosphopantetheine-binding protein [Firmicutes bacterium]|nr:phosphopantetheine-binding protein [Bacillota bacterium]
METMKFTTKEEVLQYAEKRREICEKIKEIIVEQLCLDIEPAFITDDQPLFGRGLELDSIDALELAVGIYNEFSVTVSDGESEVFSSVNTIADYVMENMDEDGDDLDFG